MDSTRFLNALAAQLKDPTHVIWTTQELQKAMWSAIRAYSGYRSLLRRIGSGVLYAAATAGANYVDVCGGPFKIGDRVTIDPAFSPQTVTLSGVTPAPVSDGVSVATRLSFGSTLAADHAAGIGVDGVSSISVASGQSNVYLPLDCVDVDATSFRLAIGARSALVKDPNYFDGYNRYLAGSGVGPGRAQGFIGSGVLPIMPPLGVGSTAPNQRQWVLVPGLPPRFELNPPMDAALTLTFFYRACHIPETLPDSDLDAILAYASHLAIEALITDSVSGGGLIKDDDVTIDQAGGAKALQEQSKAYLDIWDRRIVKRPTVVSG